MGAREIPSGVEKEGWGGYICCFTGMSVHGRSDKMLPSGEAPIRAAVCKHRDGSRFIFRGEMRRLFCLIYANVGGLGLFIFDTRKWLRGLV